MFKKESDLLGRSKSKIQNKDIKKLRVDIIKSSCHISEDELNEFFNKKESVTQVKLVNRSILYEVNDIPMFYDKDDRNNFYPTIFLLWRFPSALRNIIIHSPVSEFILNGADLMLPGVAYLQNLEGLTKGEKVCIRVLGNPLPFAVGDSLVSWETIATYGLKGKAVEVTHMYTDCLFTTATSTKRTLSPNPGFTTTRIHSLPGYIDIDCKSAYATITEGKGEEAVPSVQVEVDNQTLNYIGSSESGSMDTGVPDAMESIQSETEKLDLTRDNCDQSQDEDDVIESDAIGDDNEDSEDNKSDGIIKGDDDDDLDDVDDRNDEEISMDMILQRALFRCIKYVIKDHLLPMPVSSLWATVLKCVIEDEPRINLKKTKYRKVSEFLHQYTVSPTNLKSGILVINEVENVQYIDAIIRTHDCWRSLVLNIEDAELFREHVRGDNEGVYWNPSQKHLKGKSSAHSSKDNKIRTRSNMQGENQLSASVATSFNILNTESSEMIDSDDEMNLNRYGHHINKSKKYQFIEAYKVPKNFLSNLFSRCVDTEFGPMLKLNEIRTALGAYVTEFKLECATDKASIAIPNMGPTSELFTFCSKLPTAFVSSDASSSSSGVSGSQFQPQQEHQLSAISTKTTTLNSADKDAVEDEWHRDVWDEEEGNNSDGEEDNQELIGESYSSTAGVFIPSVQSILLSEPKTTVVTATTNNNRSINTEIQLKTSTSASSGANMPRTAVWKPVDLPPPKHSKSHKPTKKEVLLSPSTATSKNTQKLKVDTNITDGSSTVTIKKEALWKAIVSKLISYHGILPPNSELRFRVGKPPLISIIVEKRAGNKTVTRILNLELFYMDMNVLLKECRKKFACSVSLVDAVGNTKVGREVIIQGNFGPETEAMLIDTYGLSKTLIDLCMSKGIKPKRK